MNKQAITPEKGADSRVVATLWDWSLMAAGAFAANTIRAWKADWEIFSEYRRTRLRDVGRANPDRHE
jgi:hypothetical protein